MQIRLWFCAAAALVVGTWASVVSASEAPCPAADDALEEQAECRTLEQVTIFGTAVETRAVAGGANFIDAADLEDFVLTDVARALRQVPGVAVQVEDGYGLRPNISIRGTATERSSRITLLEDNVLIAPAPYAAPAAYYFPTFGRLDGVEVLKGPASITQGPYTVGGAINLLSTPIPGQRAGLLETEGGSDSTWRVHGWYGDSDERAGFLVETHQWQSDGFQDIDRDPSDTGLDKQDYVARLRLASAAGSAVDQQLDIKAESSREESRQSYLGLADADFDADAMRRYGLSALDEMNNDHQHLSASWRLAFSSGMSLETTLYNNDFERAWYKTESLDLNGSNDPGSFRGTSWANVIDAVNRGQSLGGVGPETLQAILDGADTEPGSIQLRNNARAYYSRGVQLALGHSLESGSTRHEIQAGLRYHEDQEDRLQRNDGYRQVDGQLLLEAVGTEGNAGNSVIDAQAWAVFVHDRIEWQRWTFAPGVRYESIDLSRTDYSTSGDSREPGAVTGRRGNQIDVWIPGLGALYDLSEHTRLVAGVHKGFATPGSNPGVDPEESVNFELGIRHESRNWGVEAMGFFTDYENLVGVCTNSSGSDCDPGDAFNGEGVHIPGLELTAHSTLAGPSGWMFPLRLSWTWMDAEFQTGFNSEFFGQVQAGDPVPYVPEQQLWLSLGAEAGQFAAFLNAAYADGVCTQASCDEFERTGSGTVLDLALHYRLNVAWQVYGLVENISDELQMVSREPYGARPNKPRSLTLGVRYGF